MTTQGDILHQALTNLGYEAHHSYLVANGIDCIENLELFIDNNWCSKLSLIPIGYWLRIQNELKTLQNPPKATANCKQQNTTKDTKSDYHSWTKSEAKRLRSIMKKQPKNEDFDWIAIAKEFNDEHTPTRTKKAIQSKYDRMSQKGKSVQNEQRESDDDVQILNEPQTENKSKKRMNALWTKREKKLLKKMVSKALESANGEIKSINWSDIARKLGTKRSANAVNTQYTKISKKAKKRKQHVLWTRDEENKLKQIVDDRADKSCIEWKQIEKDFNSQNGTKRSKPALQDKYYKITMNERPKPQKTRVKIAYFSLLILLTFCFCQFSTRVPRSKPIDTPKIVKIEFEQAPDDEDDVEIISGDGFEKKQFGKNDVLDIEVDIDFGSKVSTKCPISLLEMTSPYKSTRCGHTFEKDAIMNVMQNYRMRPGKRKNAFVPCPMVGCSQKFTEQHLEAVNKKKRRRSSFDINQLPPPKKRKCTFESLLPQL